MISFPVAVKNGFKKVFDFEGCATRAEYWWWRLFRFMLRLPLVLIIYYLPLSDSSSVYEYILYIIIALGGILLFIPDLSLLVRRLNDVGMKWTILLWCWVPLISWGALTAVIVATLWEGNSYNQSSTEQ